MDNTDETKRWRRGGRACLITDAQPSYEEQHRARVRKYVTLMSFRLPALILASGIYGLTGIAWLAAGILLASGPLPWMAVLIANDRPPREEPVARSARWAKGAWRSRNAYGPPLPELTAPTIELLGPNHGSR